MIADPRAVAARWPEARVRILAELAVIVTETPWLPAPVTGLTDDEVLHAIALSAYFGHLNRIADAVGVPLDYTVRHLPPHAEAATPPLGSASRTVLANLDRLAKRGPTALALVAWRDHVFERDAPLAHRQRAMIARHVGALLGHAVAGATPTSSIDAELVELAEVVTLAPWKLGSSVFAPLRAAGYDDAALFDACVVASTAGVLSRITVALATLDR